MSDSNKPSNVLLADLAGLADVARAPGVSGRWNALRSLTQENHRELWRELKTAKGFAREMRDRYRIEGPDMVVGAVERRVRRVAQNPESLIGALGSQKKSNIIWVDLGDFGALIDPDDGGKFQDHGLGLLRTILQDGGVATDLASTRNVRSLEPLRKRLAGYEMLVMNVRSYTFPMAVRVARLFKELNPNGLVITGGMHAAVERMEMEQTREFDKICTGPGEGLIVDLLREPQAFERVFGGKGAKSMAEWPMIDRTLWPKPAGLMLKLKYEWPLEPDIGWAPPPVATMLTSRVCPWRCSFCNENSFVPNMGRRPVEAVIEELNELDDKYGVGSVIMHDSMFFQNPKWLREWLEKYPKRANKLWPYWAAARSDTVKQWPELFEQLVRETNWRTVSIGFESGSDPVLRVLNKECTEDDNDFAINLLNRIGDDMERAGQTPPTFWANIMFAIPGEKPKDAIKTMRMLKRMKRVLPSVAFYAPYPGSILGHQIIAEGKSMMSDEKRDRGANHEKVRGVDYEFYRELLTGKYDREVDERALPKKSSVAFQRCHVAAN